MGVVIAAVAFLALVIFDALTFQRRCCYRSAQMMRTCIALNCTGHHVWMNDEALVRHG